MGQTTENRTNGFNEVMFHFRTDRLRHSESRRTGPFPNFEHITRAILLLPNGRRDQSIGGTCVQFTSLGPVEPINGIGNAQTPGRGCFSRFEATEVAWYYPDTTVILRSGASSDRYPNNRLIVKGVSRPPPSRSSYPTHPLQKSNKNVTLLIQCAIPVRLTSRGERDGPGLAGSAPP